MPKNASICINIYNFKLFETHRLTPVRGPNFHLTPPQSIPSRFPSPLPSLIHLPYSPCKIKPTPPPSKTKATGLFINAGHYELIILLVSAGIRVFWRTAQNLSAHQDRGDECDGKANHSATFCQIHISHHSFSFVMRPYAVNIKYLLTVASKEITIYKTIHC